jgi:hypothetical protein
VTTQTDEDEQLIVDRQELTEILSDVEKASVLLTGAAERLWDLLQGEEEEEE